jgi:hypothetical protein
MKIYGNSKSDGFSMFVVVIGALFIGGGFLLANVSEYTLGLSMLAFVGVCAAMIAFVRRWDVMSDVAHSEESTGVPVRMPNFPVKADTEAFATNVAALPVVEKPKSAVETNTAVAA